MALDETTDTRPLRADAARNRERLLAAARAAFAEVGPEVPMEEIARRAGVGTGTLYRRFPSRNDLFAALFVERMEDLARAAQEGREMDDPWEGFCHMMREGAAIQARDTAFADMARRVVGGHPDVVAARAYVMEALAKIVRRAQAAGVLRNDLVAEDVVILIFAAGDAARVFLGIAPRLWERYLMLILDGLRTPTPSPLPHPPIALEQFEAAIRHHIPPAVDAVRPSP